MKRNDRLLRDKTFKILYNTVSYKLYPANLDQIKHNYEPFSLQNNLNF